MSDLTSGGAVIAEIPAATAMKYSDDFSRILPSPGGVLRYMMAFALPAPRTASWPSSPSAPGIGDPIPGDGSRPELRHYTDEIEAVRILYFLTTL